MWEVELLVIDSLVFFPNSLRIQTLRNPVPGAAAVSQVGKDVKKFPQLAGQAAGFCSGFLQNCCLLEMLECFVYMFALLLCKPFGKGVGWWTLKQKGKDGLRAGGGVPGGLGLIYAVVGACEDTGVDS